MRFVSAVLVFLATLAISVSAFPEREAIISAVNTAGSSWTAGVNERFAGLTSFEPVKRMCGVKPNPEVKLPVKRHHVSKMASMPVSFDSRAHWSTCRTIKEIRDQSDCGSCWAFGAVEVGSDRICIETSAAKQPHLAATDLLSCCTACGAGCGGGDPGSAMQWFTNTGCVTGGNYNDFSWCVEYPLPTCDHHVVGSYPNCSSLNGGSEYNTPNCPTACNANSTYTIPYAQDKHMFSNAYSVASDVPSIQAEIMANGPVEAAFSVYADFESYKGGVYQHVTGDYLGGHAVKIIGWGVDATSNLPYWLVANSWNTQWGKYILYSLLLLLTFFHCVDEPFHLLDCPINR